MTTSLDDIQVGHPICVKVIKTPTNAAAAKTLVRVLAKDPQAKARDKHMTKVRASKYSPRMRGGRLYGGRMVRLPIVKAQIGATGTVSATVDVLRDLERVSRFIEVTPA